MLHLKKAPFWHRFFALLLFLVENSPYPFPGIIQGYFAGARQTYGHMIVPVKNYFETPQAMNNVPNSWSTLRSILWS